MAYGFEIYHPNGGLFFSSEDIGWQWIETFYVGKNQSGSKSYTLYGNETLAAHAIPDSAGGGHVISISGNTVSYSYFYGGEIWVTPYSASYISVFKK